MESGDLTDDKIYEICERLNSKDLSRLMRSNWKINDICSGELKKRKQQYIQDLISKLKGNWVSCTSYVTVLAQDDLLVFNQNVERDQLKLTDIEILLYRDMILFESENQFNVYAKSIERDIGPLKDLLAMLKAKGFKRLFEDDIWIRSFSKDKNAVLLGSKKRITRAFLEDYLLTELQQLATILGIEMIKVSTWINRYLLQVLIFNHLDSNDKVVKCY